DALPIWAVINKALGLAVAAGNLVLHNNFDGDADALLDLLAEPFGGIFHVLFRGFRIALDQQGQVIEAALLRQHALVARTQAVVFGDDFFELGWEAVHAAQDDHVVFACGNAVEAAHRASRARQDAGQVVGAVANNWQRFLGQGSNDQFAVFAIREWFQGLW